MKAGELQVKVQTRLDEIHPQLVEMGQIKTRFDSEKFTVGKEGNFIASQFHFLMRQYRFALEEIRTWLIEYERNRRWIKWWKDEEEYRRSMELEKDRHVGLPSTVVNELAEEPSPDLKILELEGRQRSLEIDIMGKACVIEDFEELRLRLIEMNDNKPPTNEQFQAEQPAYYEWFLANSALKQFLERNTGIKEGVLEAWLMAARKPIIPDSKMQIPSCITDNGKMSFDSVHEKGLLDVDPLLDSVKLLLEQKAREEALEKRIENG